jgi:hypothetical protein
MVRLYCPLDGAAACQRFYGKYRLESMSYSRTLLTAVPQQELLAEWNVMMVRDVLVERYGGRSTGGTGQPR